MTDFEKKMLEKSKDMLGFSIGELEEITKSDLAKEDKVALAAVGFFRSWLGNENKDKEAAALWRFIRYITEIEMPLRMIDYTGILFPDNDLYFSQTVTPTAFSVIQRQATLMLQNKRYEDEVHKEWLTKISEGQLPYGYSVSVKEEN